MQRMLFNASTAYVKQLPRGSNYNLLQPVYGVALLANNFDHSDQWYHHYKIVNTQDTNQAIERLQLVFVELRKFKAQKFVHKKLQTLWLRFMSELDEHTVDVPEELLAVKEIKEAVILSQESAFTPT
ncbi:MAG: PD-(D/E)XK nuclease family transposase [Gammaproteobacteria bacterium]|nr:PD-(D/E)XK nuclease family transposase [Gammaproteobacteria bacterium]